jgi:hypothetical protein
MSKKARTTRIRDVLFRAFDSRRYGGGRWELTLSCGHTAWRNNSADGATIQRAHCFQCLVPEADRRKTAQERSSTL